MYLLFKVRKLTAEPHQQFVGLSQHNLVPNGLQLGANGLNFGNAIHNQGRGFLGNIGLFNSILIKKNS